jgi:hypothetical protein
MNHNDNDNETMKITRTAPDEFNIWLRRAKGCELSSAELTAILTTIECSVHPECEGLPQDFMQRLHENLCSARGRMVQHERMKKNF